MPKKIPQEILQIPQAVTAKRAKTVLDHIIKDGHITAEESKERPLSALSAMRRSMQIVTFSARTRSGRFPVLQVRATF